MGDVTFGLVVWSGVGVGVEEGLVLTIVVLATIFIGN